MGEDVGSGLLEGSNTTSGVPIEHLDYRYVGECKNSKELEKILKVLRSGEEGHYPELIEFTEERLRNINPKSKSLRKELPINTYRDLSKSEEQEITDDLQEWMESIDQADKSLKTAGVTRELDNDNLPPIRTTTNSEVSSAKQQKPTDEKKKKNCVTSWLSGVGQI
ncbi:Sperm associated antigen 1 [Desmophyllum pertusum]|uniref:Sperm associated antigen 1 n=1 Tax=Desmophyllum pertusum TaxID=174260 RepID=A0A9W9YM79_9CNID|nr:Sperm associated antigen 1 [Desmophyllum pertusum]